MRASSWILAALSLLAYVGSVVAANALTATYGLVPAGLGLLVPAGTYCAGLALAFRDVVHERVGRAGSVAAIVVGTVLTAFLSPELALASAAAFGASEMLDMAVYGPLRRHGWKRAVVCSNVVGAVADTLIFLSLAGFPITASAVTGQLLVKAVWVTALFVAVVVVVRRAVPRQPVL